MNKPSSLFYCSQILGVLREVNRQMIDNSYLRSRRDLLFAFCPVELAYSRGWDKPLPHQSNNKMSRPIIWSCKLLITYNCAIWPSEKELWITLCCLFGLSLLGQNQWPVKKSSQIKRQRISREQDLLVYCGITIRCVHKSNGMCIAMSKA